MARLFSFLGAQVKCFCQDGQIAARQTRAPRRLRRNHPQARQTAAAVTWRAQTHSRRRSSGVAREERPRRRSGAPATITWEPACAVSPAPRREASEAAMRERRTSRENDQRAKHSGRPSREHHPAPLCRRHPDPPWGALPPSPTWPRSVGPYAGFGGLRTQTRPGAALRLLQLGSPHAGLATQAGRPGVSAREGP